MGVLCGVGARVAPFPECTWDANQSIPLVEQSCIPWFKTWAAPAEDQI